MAEVPHRAVDDQQVLSVAYCNGNRCAELRRLQSDPLATDLPTRPTQSLSTLDTLRSAIRQRPGSMLTTTGCLGYCERAPMAALGWAVLTDTGARWIQRPFGVGLLDRPGRTDALGQWIATTAPDVDFALSLQPKPLH